ncbi:ABC transporter ATP-binding protein [Alkalibacter mobilis]|uniref:ABC transporter ATP-binding protein n=1 Tax=Alkalibacter mobilis TaxID=2787712 RepID=UPI002FC2AC17
MIKVDNVTLQYSNGKGIFDVDFEVNEGQVMGYLGPNGSGKTTTIRALLGFMKPNKGACTINGMDCIKDAPEIQKNLGYIPGEIAFLDGMNGDEFLKFMCDMRGTKDLKLQKQLLEMFDLNPKGKIKKFSKGMKQKLGIVTAFMHDPEILILDEPTSGLDPLMQNRFIELIMEEKTRGKTILMSSHIIEEVEKTCDTVAIIRNGRIVKQSDVGFLKSTQRKGFIISTDNLESAVQILNGAGFENLSVVGKNIEIFVAVDQIDRLVKTISNFTISDITFKSQSMEEIFIQFYNGEEE